MTGEQDDKRVVSVKEVRQKEDPNVIGGSRSVDMLEKS